MVILLDALLQKLNERKNNLLLLAQASLPESQFNAFRKLLLNELGRNGLEGDLQKLLSTDSRNGKERAGSHKQERGCHDA